MSLFRLLPDRCTSYLHLSVFYSGGWLAQGTLTGTGSAYLNSTKAYQIPFGLQYM